MTRANSHHSSSSQAPGAGRLPRATWLSEDILLIVSRLDPLAQHDLRARATVDTRSFDVEVQTVLLERTASSEPAGALIVCRFPHPVGSAARTRTEPTIAPPTALAIELGSTTLTLGWGDVPEATTDVRTLVREHLAGLDPHLRTELLDFVASASASDLTGAAGVALSKRLFLVREALRERFPFCLVHDTAREGMAIDHIMAADDRSFWLTGWVREDGKTVRALTAVSPEGCRQELLERAFRHARPDVDKFYENADAYTDEQLMDDGDPRHGFITYLELPAPSRLQTGWMFELSGSGEPLELEGPPVMRDLEAVRDTILVDLGEQAAWSEDLALNHAYPVLSRIQERLEDAAKVEAVVQYGDSQASPDVSIIVPLYKRIDLVEFQLSQFVLDPEMERAELLYVLDSPELADALLAFSDELYKLYRVPFRIAILNRNAGFSRANNLGASVAGGRLILFLNSDVIPDRPGWLGKLIDFYNSTPDIGALGPKLLYEDDSLQHAGMYFHDLSPHYEGVHDYRDHGSSLWENEHYFKGLHRKLPAANVTRPVPAVTGACLMIDRDLFQGLGGLRGIYVQGSYEDSDLCLRLIESGRSNWYLADVELYHLEAQSYTYPTAIRTLSTKYNMWLHTHLWNDRINSMMSAPELGFDDHLASPRPA